MRRSVLFISMFAASGCDSRSLPYATSPSDLAISADLAAPPDMTLFIPPLPTAGAQIDRIGRPVINVTLTDPFDLVPNTTPDQVRDRYNAAADVQGWSSQFRDLVRFHLGVFDGFDSVCGNQVAADKTKKDMARYDLLALLLTDDRLYVDTTVTSSDVYFGVEASVLLPGVPNDCGGRTPLENVIDETYSLLTVGQLSGVTGGVTQDPDGKASLIAFPFLAPPN